MKEKLSVSQPIFCVTISTAENNTDMVLYLEFEYMDHSFQEKKIFVAVSSCVGVFVFTDLHENLFMLPNELKFQNFIKIRDSVAEIYAKQY